jgi:hypothetical protein
VSKIGYSYAPYSILTIISPAVGTPIGDSTGNPGGLNRRLIENDRKNLLNTELLCLT